MMSSTILVFGLPRSGTTWIGKLFDSHPDTLYRHEPDSIQHLNMPMFISAADAPQYFGELRQFVHFLPQIRSPKVSGKQPLFAKRYHSSAKLLAYRMSAAFTKVAGRFWPGMVLPYRPTGATSADLRIIWKSIESSGRLNACLSALPAARAIHVLRHPCGYVASVWRGEAADRFGDLSPSSEDYGLLAMLLATPPARERHLTLDGLKQSTPEERLAWRWVLTNEHVCADRSHSDRLLVVRYEDVCYAPSATTKKLFEFCGLAWDGSTESFINASTSTVRSDYYSVFKDSRASAERWRTELSPDAIERIQAILAQSTLHALYDDAEPGDIQPAQAAPHMCSGLN